MVSSDLLRLQEKKELHPQIMECSSFYHQADMTDYLRSVASTSSIVMFLEASSALSSII